MLFKVKSLLWHAPLRQLWFETWIFMILYIIKCFLWGEKKQQTSVCLAAAILSLYIWLQNKQLDLLGKLLKVQLKVMACSSHWEVQLFWRLWLKVSWKWRSRSAYTHKNTPEKHVRDANFHMTRDQVSLFHNRLRLCVCLRHWQSWGLAHFLFFFYAEKPSIHWLKTISEHQQLISLNSICFVTLTLMTPRYMLSPPEGAEGRRRWAPCRPHLPGSREDGQVNGHASDSLSAT